MYRYMIHDVDAYKVERVTSELVYTWCMRIIIEQPVKDMHALSARIAPPPQRAFSSHAPAHRGDQAGGGGSLFGAGYFQN